MFAMIRANNWLATYTFSLLFLLSTCSVLFAELKVECAEKPIVIIIPSYNNQKYCKKNLESVFKQHYQNYRVVYIDDCSTDKTYELVTQTITDYQQWDRVTLVKNKKRCGALENLYNTIHACQDYEIIITVDGDDWLENLDVLARINQEYQDPDVWLTYGQFRFWPAGNKGYCREISAEAIKNGNIRRCCGLATHLRTFYAGLFKRIKVEDLQHAGKFFPVTWDKAMMAPMLEMASPNHFRFIPDVLYVYNFINPLSDARLHGNLQNKLTAIIFRQPCYQPLDVLMVYNEN